jgi:thiol:disulfide interchange protein DsbC
VEKTNFIAHSLTNEFNSDRPIPMKKSLLSVIACAAVLMLAAGTHAAEDEAAPEDITGLLKFRLGTDNVAPAVETGVEGVYMTRFGNKFAYLIDGGRYVFIGDLVDLKEARNLTEVSRRDLVVEELAGFGEDKRIVFPAKGEELAVLNVFTDTSCGYCQQLHSEIGYLQDAGIAVHYFPFPRGGNRGPGYKNLKKVWCADDQLAAMDIAKGSTTGILEGRTDCEASTFVDDGFLLGNRIGVEGTPSLFTADGVRFNGYVPHEELIPQLIGGQ